MEESLMLSLEEKRDSGFTGGSADIFRIGTEKNNGKKRQAEQYSPLVLAYIGDAVFEVFVRRALVLASDGSVSRLHRAASALVRAEAQSRMIAAIEDLLTEKEKAVYRRGRNAKSHTTAKNASVPDYRRATGFEALMGYLYLDGQQARMLELMTEAVASEGVQADCPASGEICPGAAAGETESEKKELREHE